MTISNHVLVGTVIGLSIHQPLLSFPLALLSHFVLDALPHFGFNPGGIYNLLKHRQFVIFESLDAVGLIVLVLTVNYTVLTTVIPAILAISPDFVWGYRYLRFERKGEFPPKNAINRFHSKIQWGERPWGMYVEIAFFVVGYLLMKKYLIK